MSITGEEQIEKNPDLELPQLRFQLSLPDDLVKDKAGITQKLLATIKEKRMLLNCYNFLSKSVALVLSTLLRGPQPVNVTHIMLFRDASILPFLS